MEFYNIVVEASSVNMFLMFCVYVLVVFVFSVSVASKISPNGYKKAQNMDWPIELIAVVMSLITLLAGEYLFNIQSILYFGLIIGLLGILVEYFADWIWFQLMGSRLFIYFKHTVMGMTSIWNFPYWVFGSVLTFSCMYGFDALTTDINPISFILYVLGFAALGLIAYIFTLSIIDGIDGTPNLSKSFSLNKYLMLPISLWSGLVGASFISGQPVLIVYFIVSSVILFIGDGLLGNLLQIAFGEKYRLYTRKTLFEKNSSWYMLPLMGVVSLIGLIVWHII